MKVIPPNIPSGVIMPYGGATAPAGWLICDGSTFLRATNPALFAAIGTAWGNGDGSTTAHLPDMRGRFLRGKDTATARDPDAATRTASNSGGNTGDNVGSVQAAEVLSHTHTQNTHDHDFYFTNGAGVGGGTYNYSGNAGGISTTNTTGTLSIQAKAAVNQNTGGNETRPQNANVNYIIKI